MKSIKQNEDGLTLVELLVAIAVGAIVVASLSQVVNNYLQLSKRGRHLNTANSYVESKTEALRNTGYNSIGVGTTNLTSEMPSSLPKRNGIMSVSNQGGGLKRVEIIVSYYDNGETQSYGYTTYIGELGVGQ